MHQQTGKAPSKLELADLNATTIAAFLGHLETERGNSVRTRNARLTAIHSFFHYAALQAPDQAELIARVLGIPEKRFDTTLISYLDEPEIDALLAAPDRSTWTGRRDHALLLLAMQTGLRASELASLRRQDLQLGTGAWIRCEGKGRKERCTPLSRPTRQVLQAWLRELDGNPAGPLFPTRRGTQLTRGAIWRLVVKHVATARSRCPSLATKKITPHALRHTAAMRMLHAPDTDRYRHDRSVARPRDARLDQQVHPRRHGAQATRARPHHPAERQTGTVSPTRPVAAIPREPLDPGICRAGRPDLHHPADIPDAAQHSSTRNIARPAAQGRSSAVADHHRQIGRAAARRARADRAGRPPDRRLLRAVRPDEPWGFADPAGWKCSERYCEAWQRCPGGAGLSRERAIRPS